MPIQEIHKHHLQEIFHQIMTLLEKQEIVNALVRRQDMPRQNLVESLVARQHLVELEQKLKQLHPADIAYILENLPLLQRTMVWDLVEVERYGAVLLEVSDAVRETLIEDLERDELIDAAEHMDSDEIADLVPDLPKDMVLDLLTSLNNEDRAQVQEVLAFPEGTVGALMDFDIVTVREDIKLEVVLRYLRLRGELPEQTDQLFVVDRTGTLQGLLPLKDILIHDPEVEVNDVMIVEPIFFHTDEDARDVAQAFERYDLISAPVVNIHHRLVGCIGIDMVMDFVSEINQKERLGQAGLHEEEDLFAPIWKSAQNRWLWLALNLVTAFIASRVIGLFEETISMLVALASLMPIVASIGGNTGNQTAALIVRGLALKQINTTNFLHLLYKEVGISLLNGLLLGGVVGLFAYLLYQQQALALVMTAAMMLNLLLAALAGIFIPMGLHKLGRDPIMGSSVLLTFLTDSMGFFIFLGLASIFLR